VSVSIKETDLAKAVIAWLCEQRWDVYQEVNLQWGSETADIMAVQGPLLWVIECKTSAGLAVIEQAYRWTREKVNFVSIAVPRISRMGLTICKRFDIGVITTADGVHENLRASLMRRSSAGMRAKLRPEHKTYAEAGNNKGLRWTPFQATCSEVLRAVRANPGITFKEMIKQIDDHYASPASATNCLRRWIKAGIVKGVKFGDEKRPLKVYPC
jgi:hypothetical protein